MFSAILYGLRISLTVGVLGVLFSGTLGIILGLIAGYFGGAVDSLKKSVESAFGKESTLDHLRDRH